MLDRAVLAGRIHGLEDQQQGPAVLRVQPVLKLGEDLDALLQRFLGFGLVLGLEPRDVSRIDVGEPEALPVLDPVAAGQLARAFDQLGPSS